MSKTFKKIISAVLAVMMLLSVCSVLAYAGDTAPFRISVTVNGDTATQKGICWYTKAACDSVVKIYKGGADVTSSVTLSAPVSEEWNGNYFHKVTVSGLEAGTTYTYKVGDGNVFGDEGTFTTDNGDDTVEFIAIADVQASSLENFDKGSRALENALAKLPGADFVANLGDFTNDSTNEEWDYYDESFGELNLGYTLAPIAGNHDGLGVDYWFENMFNLDTSESVETKDGVNYSFEYGNAHFAVLNTNDVFAMSRPQLQWLENDMNSTDKDWKIVFMHKSPYTLGKDGKWPDALYLQESLAKVCDRCNVDLVMSGHDHMYLRTKSIKGGKNAADNSGTTYVLSGTAGSKRYEIRSFLEGAFINKDNIAMLNIQKSGYGNYWDGESWDNTREENIGSCFNTVSINGTTLTLNSYIIADDSDTVTNTDTFVLTKNAGENKITFTGDNTTSKSAYTAAVVPSFLDLATYAIGTWLPRFLSLLPKLIKVYITEGTF